MKNQIDNDTWVYVVVQDPGSANEQLIGFVDKDDGKQYVPVFLKKDDAIGWAYNMPKKETIKHEVQAIIYEELCEILDKNNFEVYVMDNEND